MNSLPILVLVLTILLEVVSTNEHILRLQDPPSPATILSVTIESSVKLRCTGAQPKDIQWLHNGRDVTPDYANLSIDGDASVLEISKYSIPNNDGVYECYQGSSSASIRLLGEQEVIIPPGFRLCKGKENSFCDHARACFVDSMMKPSCQCYPGWVGMSCNSVIDPQRAHVQTHESCPTWPSYLFGSILVVILCLVAILHYKDMKKLFAARNPSITIPDAHCTMTSNPESATLVR